MSDHGNYDDALPGLGGCSTVPMTDPLVPRIVAYRLSRARPNPRWAPTISTELGGIFILVGFSRSLTFDEGLNKLYVLSITDSRCTGTFI